MDLFQFTKVLFQSPAEYSDVSKVEKRRHFFMTNRFMSIQFPMQAHILGHQKINQESVMDFWHRFLRKTYAGKYPFWMYTKGAKKAQEKKDNKLPVDKDVIKKFAKLHGYELKTVYKAIETFPEEMKKELKDFEKSIKV